MRKGHRGIYLAMIQGNGRSGLGRMVPFVTSRRGNTACVISLGLMFRKGYGCDE